MSTSKSNAINESYTHATFSRIVAERMNLARMWAVLKLTPKVFGMVWKVAPASIGLMLALRVLTSVVPIAQLWLGKVLIDSLVAIVTMASSAPSAALVFLVAGAMAVTTLCLLGITHVQGYIQSYVGRQLSLYSDFLLREKVLGLDLATLERPEFHNQYARAADAAGSKPLVLVNLSMMVIESLITLLSLGVVFLALEWPITVILVATTLPNAYVSLKYSQKAYDLTRARTHDNRWAMYHASLLFRPEGFKETKILQIAEYLLDVYKQFRKQLVREDMALLRRRQTEALLSGTAATLAYYSAYIYIVYRALEGSITIGEVSFFAGAFSRCQNATNSLVDSFPTAHDVNVYLTDFYRLQDAEPELIRSVGHASVCRPIRTVEFRAVSFRYPRTDKWVLKDLNLTLKYGERVGLVGENGAGKSSLVKLLCRLYEPTEGAIYVDGVDLRELQIEQWHRAIGVIFQDFVTFADRVRDNIGYGQFDRRDNLPQIMEAARKGQADDFIRRLPQGYETLLGREFDRGEWLSGGQLQRLALARLFMRDADVLILDEPTFALDPRAEYEVYETCREHCDDKISLFVSHRFSTMRITDRIAVLQAGQIIEDGTHEDLMRDRGQYAELFELQSKSFLRG